MKITKLGHCCLVIEVNGLRIMTDPGNYSTLQSNEQNIDLILITHEHPDHLHVESLQQVLKNNPNAKIITNSAVKNILLENNLTSDLLENGQQIDFKGIKLEAFGEKHASMLPYAPQVENTGYLIAETFFYPGDAFTNPNKPVEILALPVVGPWLKLGEAIDYAKLLKPKVCFPVHDGMLKFFGPVYALPEKVLSESGIYFKVLELGQEINF